MRKQSTHFESATRQTQDFCCATGCGESSKKKPCGRAGSFRGSRKAGIRRQTATLRKPSWKYKVRVPKFEIRGPTPEVRFHPCTPSRGCSSILTEQRKLFVH